MSVVRALAVCLLLAMAAVHAEQPAPQGITQEKVHAGGKIVLSIDKTSIGIAERLRYLLIVEADADMTADFDGVGDRLGSFQVVERNPFGPIALPDNRLRWQREYVLLPTDTGKSVLPSLSVAFLPPRAACVSADDCELSAHGRRSTDFRPAQPTFLLKTDAVDIQVDTVLPPDVDLTRPRDILAPVSLASSQVSASAGREWTWVIAALATVMLAAFGFYRRRSSEPIVADSVVDATDPATQALDALAGLRRDNLPGSEQYDEHCSRLNDILRTYICKRFDIPALELTTSELGRVVHQHAQLHAAHANLEGLLNKTDLARFGHQYPDSNQSFDMIAKAEQFVQMSMAGTAV